MSDKDAVTLGSILMGIIVLCLFAAIAQADGPPTPMPPTMADLDRELTRADAFNKASATQLRKTRAIREWMDRPAIFDSTVYGGKHRETQFVLPGTYSLRLIGTAELWDAEGATQHDRSKLPTESHVRAIARTVAGRLACLNIEHWPLDIRKADPAEVAHNIDRLKTIIGWMRDEVPSIKVGIYSMVPVRSYWTPADYARKPDLYADQFAAWQAANDALQPLADAVDVLFPSLYTFYEDQGGWGRYAQGNIAEARRLSGGKPVYPFLWPQYHNSNAEIAGQMIPGDYWRIQLDTVLDQADGAVIWSWSPGLQWDESWDWWRETRKVLEQ